MSYILSIKLLVVTILIIGLYVFIICENIWDKLEDESADESSRQDVQ